MLRLGKRFVDVAALFRRDVADVAVQLLASQRRAGLESLSLRRLPRQRFVFHIDSVRRILGEGAAFRDDAATAMPASCTAPRARTGWGIFARRSSAAPVYQFNIGASHYGETPAIAFAALVLMEIIFAWGYVVRRKAK